MATKSSKTTSKSAGFSAKPQPQSATADVLTDEAMLAALQAQLTEAEEQKVQLQSTIVELEDKLATQATTLKDLKTELQATTELQAALSKAEAAARQLAALNETLMAENRALQETAIEIVESPEVTTALAAPQRPYNNLIHPVFPDNAQISGGLREQEIGWFD